MSRTVLHAYAAKKLGLMWPHAISFDGKCHEIPGKLG